MPNVMDDCGATLQPKGQHTRTFRTVFGTVTLPSPRLYHCRCQRRKTTTFRPLTALLTEPTACPSRKSEPVEFLTFSPLASILDRCAFPALET
jgi:hypothetical protein